MAREFHVDRAIRGERETRALDAAIAIVAGRQPATPTTRRRRSSSTGARDAALLAALWRVVRVTSRRMRHDGDALARQLRAILS
jgi:hypothetical protein